MSFLVVSLLCKKERAILLFVYDINFYVYIYASIMHR